MRLLTTSLLAFTFAAAAFGQVRISVNIGAAPYYGYAPRDIYYAERYVPEYDMPRVFVISRYARVAPALVVDLYRQGNGWDRICSRYGVPVAAFEPYYGPPAGYYVRGPAYGFRERHDRGKHKGYYRGRGHWRD